MSNTKSRARALTYAAMLAALSVIIGMFCKNFLNFGMGLFRITFENLPVILAGIMFGPVVGGAVGALGDIVSYLLSSQVYPPNLIVTAGAVTVGAVSGLVYRKWRGKDGFVRIASSAALAHLVGSVVIKSFGLYTFYGVLVLWRIPLYLVIASIEIALICFLFKNHSFKKLLEDAWRLP